MKKRFFIVFCLLFSISFCFAKEDFDTSTLVFIENVYNGKFKCTPDVFFENGFVKDRYGDFMTTWEGLTVKVVIIDNAIQKFSFESSDTTKLVEGWKKTLSYAQSKKCKTEDCWIKVSNNIEKTKSFIFSKMSLINYYPYANKFILAYHNY